MNYSNRVSQIKRLRIFRKTNKEKKRLDFAERTLNFDEKFFKKFLSTLSQEDLITYPSYKIYDDLTKKIAKKNRCNSNNIYFDSGSDACIKNLIQLFCKKGSNILTSFPSFPMYKIYGEIYGVSLNKVDYGKYLNFDLKSFLKKINNKTSLVILANPNSPYGEYRSPKEISWLCKKLRSKKIPLLLDEAYVEFSPGNCSSLLKKNKNLFISRTFSKCWGAAGIRVGYLIGSSKVIKLLKNIQLTYPISNISVKFANFLLDNKSLSDNYAKKTIKSRDKLCIKLIENDYDVINSHTNSIHFHEKNGSNKTTINKLLKAGYAFKYGSKLTGTRVKVPNDNRENWIRLSVGPDIEKDHKLIKILSKN